MTLPPGDPSPEIERVVDAISDGDKVEWKEARGVDAETLEALRLIDHVARLHRSGGARGRLDPPTHGDDNAPEAGRTWGNLRILGSLGAGVYGEVHRAFDPALRREVALKLWGPTVQPRIIEELLAEARALARVRDPHVLLVFGADAHDGQAGMWTELLEGCTLEQWVHQHGPVQWREAALDGIDLCRALAAVHALGLVHRDVKPANVMRERGGRIVLADFGSASRYDLATDTGASPSPGGVAGTPLAMAPEVLRRDGSGPAADLYSLGVLLHFLVTGRYPVQAQSLDELRAALAKGPLPSLRAVRPDVPPAFARVVDRALERSPEDRFASAVEMERALGEALTSDWRAAVPAWRLGLTAVAALAAILGITWFLRPDPRPLPPDEGRVPMQFTIALPAGEHLPQFANVVVSPDGSRIAFASLDSSGTSALWVRRFDSLSSSRIPGTEGATYPFWSPDSREVAFFVDGALKRVGTGGDSVRVICRADLGRGGTWNASGTILFASSLVGPLMRVPAAGGIPIPVTTLDTANAELSHRWPCFLPDGDHFLFVTSPESRSTFPLYVGSLHSDRRVYVGPVESGAVYTSGMLVYMVNQGLEARPFDVHTLRWTGEPRPISAFPGFGGSVAEPHASASQNGTLVYAFEAGRDSRLVWIDVAHGVEKELARGPYFSPSLSPDGRRVVAERVEGSGRSSIWMIDGRTGATERWTEPVGLSLNPTWSPRGDSILYSSNRSGLYELVVRAADGSLGDRSIYSTADGLLLWPDDWSADGEITFDHYSPATSYDIYALRAGIARPVVQTPERENHGARSPDGRWLAFVVRRSGRSRIDVVDRSTQAQYILQQDGVVQPRWSRSTGVLYFSTTAHDIFQVTPSGSRPTSWPVRRLFRTGFLTGFDIDARGTRLLCCVQGTSARPEEVAVLINLPAAVKRGL